MKKLLDRFGKKLAKTSKFLTKKVVFFSMIPYSHKRESNLGAILGARISEINVYKNLILAQNRGILLKYKKKVLQKKRGVSSN